MRFGVPLGDASDYDNLSDASEPGSPSTLVARRASTTSSKPPDHLQRNKTAWQKYRETSSPIRAVGADQSSRLDVKGKGRAGPVPFTPVPANPSSATPFVRSSTPTSVEGVQRPVSLLHRSYGSASMSVNARCARMASSSPPPSSSSGDDSSEIDSEEEQYPISRLRNAPGPSVLAVDPLAGWTSRSRASAYESALVAAAIRRQHLQAIHIRSLDAARCQENDRINRQVNELTSILGQIELDRHKELETVTRAYEQREAERNQIFERLVKEEEEKRETVAKVEARRRREAEAAAKAKAEREAAEREMARIKAEDEARATLKAKLKAEKEEQQLAQKAAEDANREKEEKDIQERADKEAGGARADYERWSAKMAEVKVGVLKAVSENAAWSQACRTSKRRITPKVGQLTNSAEQITKVIQEVSAVLSEARAVAQEPYIWLLNHLSKSLIKQAEEEVTSKLSAVYPLARCVVGLFLLDTPHFGEVLMARFVKKSPSVAGYRPMITHGTSQDEYRKVLGWKPGEDAVKFSERQAGITALFAAIVQTDPRSVVPGLPAAPDHANRIPEWFRPAAGWIWVSRLLRPPVVGLFATPRLVATFIEVAGEAMQDVYGQQWAKLCATILLEGIRRNRAGFNKESKPSVVMLEVMLESLGAGTMEKAKGRALEA